MSTNVKQVIVMRTDLNMRKGKMCAQAAHAALGAVLGCGSITYAPEGLGGGGYPEAYEIPLKRPELREWLMGTFTKICVGVGSHDELCRLFDQARDAGLISCLITDNGLTEFGGVQTVTCIAIGPGEASAIDQITGHLKLL